MATRNIVPRASGEGSLGTTLKPWGGIVANATVDPAISTTASNTGVITFLLSWLAKTLLAAVGGTYWYSTPPVSLTTIWNETDMPSVFIPSGSTGISVRVGRNATYTYLYVDCQDVTGTAQNPTSLTVNVALNGTSQYTTSAITTSATTVDISDFNVTSGDLLKFTVSNTTGLTGGVMIGLRKVRR